MSARAASRVTAAARVLESALCWSGAGCYGAAWLASLRDGPRAGLALWFTAIAALVYASLVAVRWLAVGHGPFLTLFEVQISNLCTLGVVALVVATRVTEARAALRIALLAVVLLALWSTQVSKAPAPLPASFGNPWLWAHVGFGKIFLGLCTIALGWAGGLLWDLRARQRMPAACSEAVERHLWQTMTLAFLCHGAMLVAGAVWANDTWGRWWAWDPLETSAFLTWLVMAVALHLRLAWSIPRPLGWCLVVAVFGLAFLTFFGMPFLSLAPHKGLG